MPVLSTSWLDMLARRMAEANVHPQQIQEALVTSPRVGDMAQPIEPVNPMSKTPRMEQPPQVQKAPGSQMQQQQPEAGGGNILQQILGDLMQPTPPTAQAGQAGQAIMRDANDGAVTDMFKSMIGGIGGGTGSNAAEAQTQAPMPLAQAAGTPLSTALAQVAGTPLAAGMPVNTGAPSGGTGAASMVGAQPGGTGSLGALMAPQTGGIPMIVKPEVAPVLAQTGGGQPLAQQPNVQPMQPTRPGIERPESATSPHLNKDAQGVEQTVMNAFYSGGVTNPFGLAALASTGKHESGFSQKNLDRSWSDPSESGHAGTSGGLFSFRNERLTALRAFAQANGESGNGSPATQAKFFLQEDPTMVGKLNGAKSVEEAMSIMNGNIAFAGYNREGGEAGRRLQTARTMLPSMQELTGKPPTPLDAAASAAATPPSTDPAAASAVPKGGDTFADRLGKLGAAIDPSSLTSGKKPPSGIAPLPQSGSLTPNPESIQMILQMLGQGGGAIPQVAPTLGQLLNGGVGGRRG